MSARRLRLLAALLALASLTGALWLEGFGPHTDDGCQTEIHCLACRTALDRPASAPTALDATPSMVALTHVSRPIGFRPDDPAPSGRTTRGPPLDS